MATTRREFIVASAAALGVAASMPATSFGYDSPTRAVTPLRILILGGTGFLGPACTESALARGHKITHFNSGRTEERRHAIGRPSLVPEGVEQLYGNRDPNKTAADRRNEGNANAPKDSDSPKGLSRLVGRKWDAVIDTSGFFPRMVKASAELLAPSVKQYLFISTISVYKDFSSPNFDETAPVSTLADPTTEDMGKDFANYGGGKAMCEKAAEQAMPGRVAILRLGFMVGPRDTSGRFLYWPVRASLGGVMIVPGAPADPIQIIDVRDLADWIVHCLEANIVGVYNVTGPAKPLSMKQMVEDVRTGTASQVEFVWIDNHFLDSHGVQDGQFPLYAPPDGPTAGLNRCNCSRALAQGLVFRPLPETARACLDWYRSLPETLQLMVAPQFAKRPNQELWLETEKHWLTSWSQRGKG
ncbi:MAG TPA: NAD-dependent epimerase/dehydratase family protein [Candidatus Baltobacteraceae bacterium]|jgi:2'-hydroxyisoflavone reductase|nr:NAD-dependent epimerase/dehydratase family protein [Candidatus Baltobacteraceae bacterium]